MGYGTSWINLMDLKKSIKVVMTQHMSIYLLLHLLQIVSKHPIDASMTRDICQLYLNILKKSEITINMEEPDPLFIAALGSIAYHFYKYPSEQSFMN